MKGLIMQLASGPEFTSSPGTVTSPPTLPGTGFVRQKLLLQCVGFSKSTLWRRVKSGLFPAPIRLSVGITAWRAEDIHRWIAEQGEAPAGAA
ncbi:AlpA family phage regulatory protein [Paucibacter sp. O1-1]|nr:AlpA family phage regulatory protein [Paucibacter sp. O1-1]MDA3824999.1 AlpA family phage regulatory protein [Paucibacter sp. O1-1]